MEYKKNPMMATDLLQLAEERGLEIDDRDLAVSIFNSVNYYRLATYWFEYRRTKVDGSHSFEQGTRLSDVISIYQFDSACRQLVFGSIEKFEIALRKQFAEHLGNKYGPFVHLESNRWSDGARWEASMKIFREDYLSCSDEFARHHLTKYPEYTLPPIWVLVELTTLGGLRHLFQNLAERRDRQAISRVFGMEEKVFESFLVHLESVRNICAHHSRLWNRKFAKSPKLPSKLVYHLPNKFNFDEKAKGALYNTLVLLDYVQFENPLGGKLVLNMKALIDECFAIDPARMGFPDESVKA